MKNVELAKQEGKLTKLEAEIMDWFLTYGLYAEKHFSDVEVADIAINIHVSIKTVRGAMASLVKKGYVVVELMDDLGIHLVYATEKGYKLDDEYEEKYNDGDILWEG